MPLSFEEFKKEREKERKQQGIPNSAPASTPKSSPPATSGPMTFEEFKRESSGVQTQPSYQPFNSEANNRYAADVLDDGNITRPLLGSYSYDRATDSFHKTRYAFTGAEVKDAPTKDDFWSDVKQAAQGTINRRWGNLMQIPGLYNRSYGALLSGNPNFDFELNEKDDRKVPIFGDMSQFKAVNWGNQKTYDAMTELGEKQLEDSKYGRDFLGRLSMDVSSGAVDLALDQLENYILPGLGTANMAIRTLGAEAGKAHREGKSLKTQWLKGLKSAAIELITEKMWSIGGLKDGGKGWVEKLMDNGVDRVAQKGGNVIFTKMAQAFGTEAVEEMTSDVLNPLVDKFIAGSVKGDYDVEEMPSVVDIAYDGLIGGLLGIVGGAGEGINIQRDIRRNGVQGVRNQIVDSAISYGEQMLDRAADIKHSEEAEAAKTAPLAEAAQKAQEAPSTVTPTETPPDTQSAVKQEAQKFNAESAPDVATPTEFSALDEAVDRGEVAEPTPPEDAFIEEPRATADLLAEREQTKTKPIGKKAAERVAGSAYLADIAKQRAGNADQAGVGVDTEGWEDTNINPALWNDRKTIERALAQNGVDYNYDPREALWDSETGQYREVDLDLLGEEERNQLLADMKQARLLDAVDNWLDKNYRKIINSKKPGYTVANARAEFQSKLSDFVRWYLANDVDNGRFALGLDEADNREKHSRAKEAGETLREIAEDKAAETRLKGKKRTKTYSKNGFDVTAIGEATYRVVGPGGRESVQVANGIDEAIQKHTDEGSESAKKAAEQRKTKEAELEKMRKEVIESGENPAQVDGSDGNTYEVTKQFSNEQQTRYEYVVTELDEDGLPSDREARVFQNRASTNEEAVQYAIDNDLFREDDYSDLTEGSNDEVQGSEGPRREDISNPIPGDGRRQADAASGSERNLPARKSFPARWKTGRRVSNNLESAIRADFGDDAVVIDPDGWRADVTNLVKKLTGKEFVWVLHGEHPPTSWAGFCTFEGEIALSLQLNRSPTIAKMRAMHEVVHAKLFSLKGQLIAGDAFKSAAKLTDEIFTKSSVPSEEIKRIRSRVAIKYMFKNGLPSAIDDNIDVWQDEIDEWLSDKDNFNLNENEVLARMVAGDPRLCPDAGMSKELQDISREIVAKNGLFEPEDFSDFPGYVENLDAWRRVYGSHPFAAETNSSEATRQTDISKEPTNAKEYAYSKKLEAEQNSEEAKEQAQSDEEKAKSTFGKDYEKVQKSADDFDGIKTRFDEESFQTSDKGRDRSTRGKLKKLREAFRNAATTGDVETLFSVYEDLKNDSNLANFYNEEIQEDIDNWRKLSDKNLDSYNEGAAPYAAARTMQRMAHKFKLANDYQQTLSKMNETLRGSKNGVLRKIGKSDRLTAAVARALMRWQVNPDTVFKMIDAFDKGNAGEGYKLAKELQTAHREKYRVLREARATFDKASALKGFQDFAFGKQTVKDYSGREWDMRSALSVVKAIDTIRSTSGKKLGGTDGFGVMDNKGNIEFISMKDVDAVKLYESLKSGLSDVAIKYGDLATEAFNAVKELLRAKYKQNNGVDIGMIGDEDTRLGDKKGIEKAVYSPLSYVDKSGNVYQFDIAKQETYNNIPRFLRERSDAGGTYILIKPYTEVTGKYFEQVSNYLAYSTFNEKMKGLGKSSSYESGLGNTLAEVFGKDMGNWYKSYVEDLATYQNEDDVEGVNSLLRKGRQQLQQGALLFSVSVPMKQISSYWAASGILHPDSLIKNYRIKLLRPKNSSDAATMLASRAMGNLEQSAAEAAKDAEKWLGKLKYSSKFVKLAADAINQMDYNTVSNLLSATEYDVLKYQFNGDKSVIGTDEYKTAVEEKFQDVVDRSQPNFDKQMRAEYGRTDNEIVRMLSMFRTQQTQNLNLLATAIGEFMASKGTRNESQAATTLKQTIAGQAASALSLSMLTILADMLLHRQKKYEDEEKELDASKILARLGINAIEASSGTLWFGDTIAKWAIDRISGGKTKEFYGVNMGVISTVSDILENLENFVKNPSRSNARYCAGNIATLMGVPLNNAYSMLNSVIMYGKDLLGSNDGDYDDILKYLDAQAKAKRKEEEKAAKEAAKNSGADLLADTAKQNSSQSKLNSQDATEKAPVSGYLTKPYNALIEAGMSSQRSQEVLGQIDTDGNNSVKQAEMIAYWKAHPEDEQYVIAMWNSYGYKTTWEAAKKKAG